MTNHGDERAFRSFEVGWGIFDVDVQAVGGGDEHAEEEHAVVQDFCDKDSAGAKCSFCEESGSVKLSEEEQGEGQARFDMEVTHACPQDYDKHFAKYSFYNGRVCCNPYGSHTKRITERLTLITLNMHKVKRCLIPGKKLCKRCFNRFQGEVAEAGAQIEGDHVMEEVGEQGEGDHEVEEEEEEGDHDGSQPSADLSGPSGVNMDDFDSQESGPHEWSQDRRLDTVNRAFDILSESPVKGYKVGNKTYVEGKIMSLSQKIRDELQVGSPESDSDCFIASLKERFDSGDRDDKYRCLTLCPASWGSRKLADTFNCSRNMAESALELRAELGPGSFPGKKQGRGLPIETIKKVTDFYLDQDISRNMPGKRDVVMIRGADGKREAVQKRLFLSNLNEGFAAFRMRNPLINVGFSKFAELRPPQIILPGQSGTHRY